MTTTTNLEARREAVQSIASAMRQACSTVYGAWLDDDRLLDFWYEAYEAGAISTEPPTEELWFGRHAEPRPLDTAEFDDLLNEALDLLAESTADAGFDRSDFDDELGQVISRNCPLEGETIDPDLAWVEVTTMTHDAIEAARANWHADFDEDHRLELSDAGAAAWHVLMTAGPWWVPAPTDEDGA